MSRVSYIMAVLNGAKTIARAIDSVQKQTTPDVEIVVVDDGSTDTTVDVVQGLMAQDARIKLVRREVRGGCGAARNSGIPTATGEWIAILDADDWIEAERTENMLKAAAKIGADVVCDNMQIFDHAAGRVVDRTAHAGVKDIARIDAATYFRLNSPLRRYSIGYTQPMVKKAFLAAHHIAYSPVPRPDEDSFFMSEILLKGGKVVLVPGAYYVYVHWLSPTTGVKSPHSHSRIGQSDLIVRGCDELLERYGSTMNGTELKALKWRRFLFEIRHHCDHMIAAMRQRKFMQALTIIAAHPFILVMNAATIRKRLHAKLLNILSIAGLT